MTDRSSGLDTLASRRLLGLLGCVLAIAVLALPAGAQDAGATTPVVEAAAEATPVADAATPSAEAPAADTEQAAAEAAEAAEVEKTNAADQADEAADTSDAAGDDESSSDQSSSDTTASDDVTDAQAKAEGATDSDAPATPFPWVGLLSAIAVVVLPIMFGNWLGKALRVPEQGWRIATVLVALSVAGLAIATGRFKGGPDLAGGITLVYEIARDQEAAVTPMGGIEEGEAEATDQPDDQKAAVDVDKLIGALKQRIDPAGTKEVTIRRYGDAIEIIIPHAGPDDLKFIKRRITDLGQLEFRIAADPRYPQDRPIIEKGLSVSPSEKLVRVGDTVRAEWVVLDEREFPEGDERVVRRSAGKRQEALVLRDRYDVTGEYLTVAAKGIDDVGKPSVDFSFNASGARRFGKLTGDNLPNEATGSFRQLGILLDKKLISAPRLNSRITDRGTISGGAMTEEEVDFIISILNAGSLPAALNKEPISEETVSATLGATTIEMGTRAMLWSVAAVVVFIIFYYRFAGVVACLGLVATLVLVVGAMVALNAAFTLPGLAGLVLTVGMAVDANVLIYERIREELAKGSGLRMAIRNGFDRASTTIIDSNLTTLLTGVVLYVVGTDQIKGFAVSIVLGLIMSLFVAVFATRVVFEIAERRRWIKDLRFVSFIGETNIDFLALKWPAIFASLAVIAIGAAFTANRGLGMLNIDFTGGTSVTLALKDDAKMPLAEVREALEGTVLKDQNLLVVERGFSQTRYTVTTSVDEVADAKQAIADALDDKMQLYTAEVGAPTAFTEEGGYSGVAVPLKLNQGPGFGEEDGLAHDSLLDRVATILEAQGRKGVLPQLENPDYLPGSSAAFRDWTLKLGLPEAEAVAVANTLADSLKKEPLFPLANKIGGAVASDLQGKAIAATLVSLLGIVAYVWFRFQSVNFGLAAVVALIHDVLVTIAAIAASNWLVMNVPGLASSLQIESFQIGLTIVAALITIIGFSLNDTIVIFDRIREVRGKSPKITREMINKSVNQTLARTILTSLTVFMVVVVLYFFGGPGIHGFAFAMVVGVVAGTYSTVFIASPVLLWLSGSGNDGAAKATTKRAA
ncbi:MAG: protein translocase subunit SecD [Lacipirellulaceae bacterium]